MNKQDQQQDVLPEFTDILRSNCRGTMQRRIQLLEQALAVAQQVLIRISNDEVPVQSTNYAADTALDKIAEILR